MQLIRPEAAAALSRWREVLVGLTLAVLGLNWGLASFGPLRWLGWVLVALGAALIVTGIQRARFRRGGDGPGVVTVDERRVSYFGPLTGGTLALDDLTRLSLDGQGRPAHWRLDSHGQPPLMIPVTAEGADALFDAFAALPGMETGRLLAALDASDRQRGTVTAIWTRRAAVLPPV